LLEARIPGNETIVPDVVRQKLKFFKLIG
jgi:hypothetical protein